MAATNKCLAQSNKSRTFAEVRASRNTIETVSLSRRNNFHANVCAPVELAPSRQATNGQRRGIVGGASSSARRRAKTHTSVNLRSAAIKSVAGTASVAGDGFLSVRQLSRCQPGRLEGRLRNESP